MCCAETYDSSPPMRITPMIHVINCFRIISFSFVMGSTGCARKVGIPLFSVQSLCSLCLCGSLFLSKTTTETQRTQRLHREEVFQKTFRAMPVQLAVHDLRASLVQLLMLSGLS